MQKLVIGLAAAIILGIAGTMAWMLSNPTPSSLMNAGGVTLGGPFELTAHTGQRMSSKQVIDRPALVYFGYTFCPDVCPVDVQHMVDTTEILAKKGIDVRPVFISVDPGRDTVKALAEYAEAMSPRMIALTGTEAEVKAAIRSYGGAFSLGKADANGSYLVSHSTFTYIMTPDRGMVGIMRRKFTPEVMARDVRKALGK